MRWPLTLARYLEPRAPGACCIFLTVACSIDDRPTAIDPAGNKPTCGSNFPLHVEPDDRVVRPSSPEEITPPSGAAYLGEAGFEARDEVACGEAEAAGFSEISWVRSGTFGGCGQFTWKPTGLTLEPNPDDRLYAWPEQTLLTEGSNETLDASWLFRVDQSSSPALLSIGWIVAIGKGRQLDPCPGSMQNRDFLGSFWFYGAEP